MRRKFVCALNYGLPTKVMLGELGEPVRRILFILIRYLRVNGGSENVPLNLQKSATKSSHGFGAFGRYPVVVAVKWFSRVYVVFHDTKSLKLATKNLNARRRSDELVSKIGRSLPIMEKQEICQLRSRTRGDKKATR